MPLCFQSASQCVGLRDRLLAAPAARSARGAGGGGAGVPARGAPCAADNPRPLPASRAPATPSPRTLSKYVHLGIGNCVKLSTLCSSRWAETHHFLIFQWIYLSHPQKRLSSLSGEFSISSAHFRCVLVQLCVCVCVCVCVCECVCECV